ncbi:hypothetical protein BDZ97DRAFT_571749 [Flammula alnicola]|nr:hypothetical protein BDZ97DRAFT_571749 [Flammula alnicola]
MPSRIDVHAQQLPVFPSITPTPKALAPRPRASFITPGPPRASVCLHHVIHNYQPLSDMHFSHNTHYDSLVHFDTLQVNLTSTPIVSLALTAPRLLGKSFIKSHPTTPIVFRLSHAQLPRAGSPPRGLTRARVRTPSYLRYGLLSHSPSAQETPSRAGYSKIHVCCSPGILSAHIIISYMHLAVLRLLHHHRISMRRRVVVAYSSSRCPWEAMRVYKAGRDSRIYVVVSPILWHHE